MLGKLACGVAFGVVAVVAACGSEQPPSQFGSSSGNAGDGGGSTGTFGSDIDSGPAPPPIECKKMDIVFVIDNSPSMKEEQTNLAANFPGFFDVINTYKTQAGDLIDYRIAITSTDDVHDKGAFRSVRGQDPDVQSCDPGPNDKPWLERTDGDVSKYFQCRGRLGTLGSTTELPLECSRLSVTDRINDPVAANKYNGESFIRPDALLAFVILTDEDEGGADQAATGPLKEVSLYAADFDAVKSYRGRWAAAAIAGEHGCNSPQFGEAAEAVRLKQFIATVGKNGVFSDICQGNLSQGLKDALKTFTEACKDFPGVK